MTYYDELPFGGFQGFVKTVKEIVEEKFPNRKDLQKNLDEASPSTEFGIGGLGMREEFVKVTERLMEIAKTLIADDGPSTSLGGYMASAMAARHARESQTLKTHLQAIERNKD